MQYRFRETVYHITAVRTAELRPQSVIISESGRKLNSETIQLIDDRREHHLEIRYNSDPAVGQTNHFPNKSLAEKENSLLLR
jgi:hypothetical protein